MRGILVVAVAAAALGACASGSAGTSSTTSLKIVYWENRQRPDDRTVWTLRCNPARGTLARPARACQRLADGGMKLFAPLPRDVACTQIYGGPQSALVTGTFEGKRVWARFSRHDGCQISRWNRLAPWLLPPGGAS
jgi:hypothetical protein